MDKVIHVSTVLQRDPHQAFAYFTQNRWLEQWLTKVADVEPFVGGKYELFWNPDDRTHDSTIGCRITAIVKDKLLAFEWKGPRQYESFAYTADPLTHVVVSFIPEESTTHVHLIHSGWCSTAEWEEMRVWFERAWQQTFAKLESMVNLEE
ncbi:MAG: SRPBCC domain-containing protein [Anaerolineae bacterium]|nr:SRPBCC domain-containing protein [Anaerolineae bacterium]